ncbi:methyl-accepting chemotaxis protein [Rhodoblastus acidophilus]|uniref:methyl-accepting chemotaxis protein n=1 Tax=Rhodoblastus acidophilus TaxID=1074 RepID=UPI002224F703|nr:methyl-accepting chemotaxis protein [Rhodoblastus acidophilus]MCW2283244.1 methyl-accepting chemotaxis protein [Rhodoblastus acidophilus]MCW2332104.1 methyl-accepting chemotaxis protein [Rhodoblastus acidophilus]
MTITSRILALVLMLGLAIAASVSLGVYALQKQNAYADELDALAQRAFHAEQINRAIAAVTGSNRGAIIARTQAERDDYRKEMAGNIKALEGYVDAWSRLVPAGEAARFDAFKTEVAGFVKQRLALQELAASAGAEEGMRGLKSPEVREQRLALQKTMSDNIDAVTARLATLRTEKDQFSRMTMIVMVAASLAALGLAVTLALWFGAAKIARPLQQVTRALQDMAAGNLDEIPEQRTVGGEIGALWDTTRHFQHQLREAEGLRAQNACAESERAAHRQQVMAEIVGEFQASVGGVMAGVAAAAQELRACAETVTRSADETSLQIAAVASASDETSVNVRAVASAAEELSASVGEIGQSVAGSARMASDSEASALDTAAKVRRLAEAAQRIGDIVGLITSIAEQTNLLALNATIEAARAGEAGKGFAVVAQEVKTLAAQTARATSEIAHQIREIQDSTSESSQAIGGINALIHDLNACFGAIASSVQQQDEAAHDIAVNVTAAARGAETVSSAITKVTAHARQSRDASTHVRDAAKTLSERNEELNRALDKFLKTMLAA